MNVEVNEKLIEEARRVTGGRTDADVVRNALMEVVRIADLKRGVQALRDTNEVF